MSTAEGSVLDGQVAIVTGAGEGIGLAIATEVAEAGAQIVLNDIDATRARDAVHDLESAGYDCIAVEGDAGDREVIERLVSVAVKHFGKVDLLAANAGITLFRPFLETTAHDLDRLMRVNLRGSFLLAQAAAKIMIENGGGRILFTSSITGIRGHAQLSAYGMTKAAIDGLVRGLAVELSGFGIGVNALLPGATITPRNLEEDPDYASSWAEKIPAGRAALPGDQAAAALFLLSPSAGHITGHSLVVDGGWTIRGD